MAIVGASTDDVGGGGGEAGPANILWLLASLESVACTSFRRFSIRVEGFPCIIERRPTFTRVVLWRD